VPNASAVAIATNTGASRASSSRNTVAATRNDATTRSFCPVDAWSTTIGNVAASNPDAAAPLLSIPSRSAMAMTPAANARYATVCTSPTYRSLRPRIIVASTPISATGGYPLTYGAHRHHSGYPIAPVCNQSAARYRWS
jgi:hypothetical protein